MIKSSNIYFNEDLKEWLKLPRKLMLINGKSGTGKTEFAHSFLKENGYNIVEFNSSMVMSILKKELKESLITKDIVGLMTGKKDSLGIIIDELDTLSNDKSVLSEIYKLLTTIKYNSPVICITNTLIDKKIKELRKISYYIELKPNINKFIGKYPIEVRKALKKYVGNDIRLLKNTIEYLGDEITIDKINSLGKKNLTDNLFEIIDKTLNIKNSYEDNDYNFNYEIYLYPFMIHENYIKKKRNLLEIARCLSEADIINTYIFKTGDRKFNNYISLYSSIIPNYYLSTQKKISIDYTSLYPKTLVHYSNIKFINTLIIPLEYSSIIVYNLLVTNNLDYVYKMMKLLNLTVTDLSKMVRYEKLKNKNYNKLISTKTKNLLNNLCKS